MSEPIVFISHHKLKKGRLADFRQYYLECVELIDSTKPGTVGFLAYLNEEQNEVSIVHLFPDADAMDDHIQGARDRARGAYEFFESKRLEVYGSPSDEVLQMMVQIVGSGVELTIKPESIGGYIRLKSG